MPYASQLARTNKHQVDFCFLKSRKITVKDRYKDKDKDKDTDTEDAICKPTRQNKQASGRFLFLAVRQRQIQLWK